MIQHSSRFDPKPDVGKPDKDLSVSIEGSKYHNHLFDKVLAHFGTVIEQGNPKFNTVYSFDLNHFFHAIVTEYSDTSANE